MARIRDADAALAAGEGTTGEQMAAVMADRRARRGA
jgi:hypothetical protein